MVKQPLLGVFLLVVCIVAQFAFGRFHVEAGSVITTALAVGLALVYGAVHTTTTRELASTKDELTTLRASLRPAREPSMHDIVIVGPEPPLPNLKPGDRLP